MEITITADDASLAQDHGSVALLVGTAEDGTRVSFGAEHRLASAILEALLMEHEDEISVSVAEWQIVGVLA